MSLTLQPIDWPELCQFVKDNHRHHKPPRGWKFGLAANDGSQVVGVASIGRPVNRYLDDGLTLEINRLATDGTPNACSFLWGACRRAVLALGYRGVITYTLPEEGGASLRAAGFRLVALTDGGPWSREDRKRVDTHPLQGKLRWEAP